VAIEVLILYITVLAVNHNHPDIMEKVKNTGIVEDPKVSFLAEGYGNKNYLVKGDDRKIIYRVKKDVEDQFADSLEREFTFLRYAEHSDLDFCPKVFFYDEDDGFLLEECLEGEKVPLKDLSKEQLDQYAKQLAELSDLEVEEFFEFCEENNLKPIEPDDDIEQLQKYGFKRFEEAKNGDIPEEVIEWIDSRLNENLSMLESMSEEQKHFDWGDIPSNVIIDSDGNVKFYDFEHVAITSGNTLSYIKIHGGVDEKQFDFLVDRYADHSDQNKGDMRERMQLEERITRVNDVVWAAMKWAQTGEKKFEDLTYERMGLLRN